MPSPYTLKVNLRDFTDADVGKDVRVLIQTAGQTAALRAENGSPTKIVQPSSQEVVTDANGVATFDLVASEDLLPPVGYYATITDERDNPNPALFDADPLFFWMPAEDASLAALIQQEGQPIAWVPTGSVGPDHLDIEGTPSSVRDVIGYDPTTSRLHWRRLAQVAFDGSYNSLIDKPTNSTAETATSIRDKLQQLTGNARLAASAIQGLPTAETATSIRDKLQQLTGNARLAASAIQGLPGDGTLAAGMVWGGWAWKQDADGSVLVKRGVASDFDASTLTQGTADGRIAVGAFSSDF